MSSAVAHPELSEHPAVEAARASDKPVAVFVDRDAPWPDEAVRAAIGPCHPAPVQLADGRWLATRMTLDPPVRSLAVLDGQTRRELPFPWDWEPMGSVRVTPDGGRALLSVRIAGRGQVVERRLDGEGEWSVVITSYDPATPSHPAGDREKLWSADYAGDADLVVVALSGTKSSDVALLHREGDGWREAHRASANASEVVCRGRFVIARSPSSALGLAVVGEGADARLVKGARLEKLFYLPHPADTREWMWGHRGVGREGHVLVGDEAAVAKAARKKR